ncbi:hypothetical protein [Thalassotalea piscium]|uniref:DUF3630 family protein n=1 Tax=Thalassotalea piscium TaxID=1230533 RepID=A0A7X0TSX7_9GAMM|nr:hypothetical protein [Thalassotalea piscium]MBB6542564.1 hypothetical protein [Thalassotalea piscium]
MTNNYLKAMIKRVQYNDSYQTITFQVSAFSWHQEALALFIEAFFTVFKSAKLVEVMEGADRMNARFIFQQAEFIICLESSCEAIWIEAYGEDQITNLHTLYQEIERLLKMK